MSPDKIDEILRRSAKLPDTAVIPVPAVAIHDNVSERTIRRNYPLVEISPGRHGVRLGYLRNRTAQSAA
jgi:hypothetical protein